MPAHSTTDINPGSNGFTDPHGSTKEFVISGLSGRLPESDNIAEFREHLINGDDMVTDDGRRWEPGKQQLWFPMVTDDGRRWEPGKQLLWFPMVTDDGRRWRPGKQLLWFIMVTDDGKRWKPGKQLLWFPVAFKRLPPLRYLFYAITLQLLPWLPVLTWLFC